MTRALFALLLALSACIPPQPSAAAYCRLQTGEPISACMRIIEERLK